MRFSLRTKLLAAFAIDLLLMIALGTFAAYQMGVMNERAMFVENHTIPSVDGVGRIQSVINRYRVQQLEYLIYTNSFDKDRAEQKMRALEAEMMGYLDAYLPLVSDATEEALFADVIGAWERIVTANHTNFIPALSLANTGSVQPFYSRMNPLYDRMEQAVAALAAESQQQAAAALTDVQATYNAARNVILADTLFTLVISAIIALVLSGRIAMRVRRLTSATVEVARGDLTHPVAEETSDELGVLARNFNQMVVSLREQRAALEQQNAALQASLVRQEQLTVDLVRRKQSEAEAQRAQAAAEAASQAKSRFLATMSHELRTPLNAMIGYAQILRLTIGQHTDHTTTIEQLDRIMSAGKHLTALISNVLDFAKIEQGKIDLFRSEFDLAALVHETAAVVEPLVGQQANRIVVQCPPDLGMMYSDAGKIRQILYNLLANAAKFTSHGTITLDVGRDDAAVVFAVCDTGIGIAPEQLAKLFVPFSQVDAQVTRRYDGTGLGLAVSRELAHVLGGTISVQSVPGQGSTFTLRLPLQLAADAVAGLTPAPAP
jgi:signal transduction histidine kinase